MHYSRKKPKRGEGGVGRGGGGWGGGGGISRGLKKPKQGGGWGGGGVRKELLGVKERTCGSSKGQLKKK